MNHQKLLDFHCLFVLLFVFVLVVRIVYDMYPNLSPHSAIQRSFLTLLSSFIFSPFYTFMWFYFVLL